MKIVKIFLGIILSIIALLAVLVIALVIFINPNDYKPQLEKLAAQQNVVLHLEGNLAWSFYPRLGIHSGKFSIKPPIKNITKPLQFDEINVSVRLLPLLHRKIIADTVIVRGQEIMLHDDATHNDTTISKLFIQSKELNVDQKYFPLSISMQVATTHPSRKIAFKVDTQISLDKNIKHISLTDLLIQVDNTQLKGKIDALLGEKPFITALLSGDNLDLDHYLPETEVKKENRSGSTAIKEDSDVIPASSIQALPGNYQISFDSLTLQHLTLNQFSTEISISHEGLLNLKKLSTILYGGSYLMHGTVDTRPALPAIALDMSLKNLALEPALKDYLRVEKTFASGDFGFEAKITTQGLKQSHLIRALNGEFSIASNAITLNKLDLTSSLDQSLLQLLQVKLPKLMSADNQTVLNDMKGKGVIRNGLINNTSLTAHSLCTLFSGQGSFDLPSSVIDYHLGITFPSADTNKTCAEINPKLKDITWPIACKGTTANDTAKLCRADSAAMQAMIKKSAKKEAGKKLEEKIDKQLNKKFGKDSEQVKQLLKGLL